MAYTKKWNGSAWVDAPVKKWNGSSWVDAKTMKWSGSAWVQLWPNTAVTVSRYYSSTSFNTWRSKWDGGNVAKQGVYSTYAAAHGYLGINANSIEGNGNISSIGSATYTAKRDGSGSYGSNQTIRFHRSNIAPASSSPVGTMSGQFNSTSGAPGSGGTMSNRPITINTEVVNWMNKANNKQYLYIYSSSSGDYLGMNGTFTINLNNYVYTAKTITFDSLKAKPLLMTPSMYNETIGGQPYHSMTIYEEEQDMTLEEIIERRENGIVSDIAYDSIMQGVTLEPWTRNYEIFTLKDKGMDNKNHIKIEVFDMQWDDEAQFSIDGEEWFTLIASNPEDNYLYGELPIEFNKYRDFVYIRIIDKVKEIIHKEQTIEPVIYIPDQSGIIVVPGDIDLDSLLK